MLRIILKMDKRLVTMMSVLYASTYKKQQEQKPSVQLCVTSRSPILYLDSAIRFFKDFYDETYPILYDMI